MKRTCETCDGTDDCRPYGVGGAWICLPCMEARPRGDQLASFASAFDAAQSRRRVDECVTVGNDLDGPTVIKIPAGPGRN